MFALGHLGIGKKLAARPFRHFSPAERRAFFVGALLPDLIDKPLYYIPAWLTGKEGAAAGILSGTHLFAHSPSPPWSRGPGRCGRWRSGW